MVLVPGVQPYGSSFDLVRDAQCPTQITGLDARGESVGGVVGDANGIGFILEADDRENGSEDLFARDLKVVGSVRKKCRFDEEPLAVDLSCAATRSQSRGRLFARLDVGQNFVVLRFGCNRTDLGLGVERVTQDGRFCHDRQLLNDFVVDGLFDEQARSSDTHLSLIPEDAPEGSLYGGVDMSIGEYDIR